MFAQDTDARRVARSLRVSTKSVYQWRRVAIRGRGGPRLERRWREPLQAGRGSGRAAARGAGGRPGGLRMGVGPAVDTGPGRGAGHALVRRLLHAARGVVPAAPDGVQPAGSGAPRVRAGRGRGRRLAVGDLGEGTRLAAGPARGSASRTRPGRHSSRTGARTWVPRPGVGFSASSSSTRCVRPAFHPMIWASACAVRRRAAAPTQ